MRKLAVAAASIMMLFAACQKDEGFDGGVSQQTITVTVPGQESLSRAAGDGASINRCVLQIYRNDAKYGGQQIVPVTSGQATFNLRLVAGQEYDFVFWADKEGYYNTTDLSAITWADGKDYTGNDEGFDAFFYALTEYKVEEAFTADVTLKRPFGQLNIKTTDLNEIYDESLKPTHVKVAFTEIPTTFNAWKGTVGTETDEITYTAEVLNTTGDLSVDYILANPDESALANFSVTFLNGTTEINTNSSFTNIPIRRNYQTNISGNLLTKAGDFNVTIEPKFEEPAINCLELREALEKGGRVILNEDVTLDAPLVVDGDGKVVDIDLNGHDIINNVSVPDAPDSEYGNTTVFEVKGGATLNIRGDGKVHAISTEPNEDGYRMAVYALDNSTVNIYGGDFMNDQDYNNKNAQLDLIYADQNATINIYGGRFESKCANSRGYWVLNLKDKSNAQINVHGGTFVNFDPSSSMTENPVKDFVVSTSTTVKISDEPTPNGTYMVVPQKGEVEVSDADEFMAVLNLANEGKCEKIVLSTDMELTKSITLAGELDLNQKLLKTKDVTIPAGGVAEIVNGNIEATVLSATKGAIYVNAGGELTVDNVVLNTNGVGIFPQGEGTKLVVRNSSVTGVAFGVSTNASEDHTLDIVLENSTFNAAGAAVMMNVSSTLTVNNCTLTGNTHGLIVRGGTATVSNSTLTVNYVDSDYAEWSTKYDNIDWEDGNGLPSAALTLGNKGAAYQYSTNVTLKNTKLKVAGLYASYFPALYAYANQGDGLGVTFTYDDQCEFDKDPVYASENITVNGEVVTPNVE